MASGKGEFLISNFISSPPPWLSGDKLLSMRAINSCCIEEPDLKIRNGSMGLLSTLAKIPKL